MTDQVVDPNSSETSVAPGSAAAVPESHLADPVARIVAVETAGETAVERAGAAEEALAVGVAAGDLPGHEPVIVPIQPGAGPELASAPRRRAWAKPFRFVGGFLFGLLAVMALSAGGLYAFDLQYSGRILPGVRVGDVDLSGLTASQATARLAEAFDGLSEGALVLTAGELSATTPLAELGRRADVEAMVARAVAVGRDGPTLQRFVVNAKTAAQGVALEPQVVVDRAAVERAVSSFVAYVERRPVDARVDTRDGALTLVEGIVGRRIDGPLLESTVLAAITPLDVEQRVEVTAAFTPVEPVITTQEAAAALETANRMAIDVALVDIFKSWTIPAATIRSWISFEVTGAGGYRAIATPAGLDAQLTEMATAILRPPSNAGYLFDKNGKIVGASEGKEGRSLDKPGTLAAIATLLAQRAGGASAPSVAPSVITVKPEITTEQASASAPLMKKISEWTTYFPIYINNAFGANIWIPAMDLDGYLLAPGAVFDFWKAIGPVTRERGYSDGGAIINGKTEPQGALAGGICSTSTTLFNAALRAGLKMGARRNHYYYISRYPLGLDATVFQSSSGSVQTMSFTNDTGHPLLIRAYKIKNGTSGYVKFELWGVPTGRTVTIEPEVVKNINPAVDTRVETDTLPVGTTERLESPADGKDVWRTVVVRDASGTILYQTTYYSHYARVDGVTLVGTAPKP